MESNDLGPDNPASAAPAEFPDTLRPIHRTFRPDPQNLMHTLDQRYEYALQLLDDAPKIQQGDRMYTTVASRMNVFRRAYGPRAAVVTEVTHADEYVVRARAELWIPLGQGVNDMQLVARGHSEEFRNAHDVNMWSATENAETSAIGRALAAFGLHGGEFASANEVDGAKAAQESTKELRGTEFLTSEEVTAAIDKVKACTSLEQLAEVYLRLNPALKVACAQFKNTKHRELSTKTASNEQHNGSETAKGDSQGAPSPQRAASGRRRGQSNGGA